ncbi:MAG: TonB-dependent receptor [Agriterribacter sp.]
MKFLAVCLLAFALNVSAKGFSQTITLNERSISYQQLFKLINEQTGYQVLYKANLLNNNEKFHLSVDKVSIDKVLTLVLKNKPVTYSIVERSIVIMEAPGAASPIGTTLLNEVFATIKGVVKDQDGQPLSDVSVTVKGTSKGTLTRQDGSFSIDVKAGESLVFSRVGYKPVTIKPGTETFFTINMEIDQAIGDEVIIVGYGTQKKRDVSGAVATISKELLESRPINNMMQGLQGLSPDLVITRSSGQPGNEGWSMQLRGASSINGTNNPLVIVDGTEYPDLNQLNPSDIETITILKDAATSSIYGAKAANGVILITTKTGKTGKLQVNYSGMYQVKRPLNVPEILPYWKGWSIQKYAQANAQNLEAPTIDSVYLNLLKTGPGYILNDGTYNTRNYFNTDYVDLLLQKYYANTSHNIGVSGGNENNKYFIGLGMVNNDGILKVGPDSYKRQNVRFNLNSKFNKFLSLDTRIAYTRATTMSAGGSAGLEGSYSLLYNIYNLRNNVPIHVPGYPDRFYGNATYGILKEGGYDKKLDQALDGTFTLSAKNIVPGLVLSSMFAPRIQQTNQDELDKPVYFWSASPASDPNAPLYDATAPVNWVQNTTPVSGSRSQIAKGRRTQTSYTYNALVDYTTSFNDHHFHVLAGFQYQYYDYDSTGVRQSNLSNTTLPTVNYTTNENTPNSFLGDRLARNTLVSYFGRFNYDYKSKYYIEFNVRSDASSRLAPGYQSKTYPGISAAWRLSEEGFFRKNIQFINELKVRASWGKLGNAQLSQYPWERNYLAYPTLSSTIYPFNGTATNGLYLNTLASGAFGWETITTKNIGVDFTLLNNKLSGSVDFYNKTNDNMLISVPLPAILGIGGATTNDGKLVTKGWGFSLNWSDNISDFRYQVGFNLSDNTNKLVTYSGTTTYGEGQRRLILGMPLNTVWAYQALGYFATMEEVNNSPKQFNTTIQGPGDLKYADINKDNIISAGAGTAEDHGDLVNFGTTDPRYLFGLTLGASWKNIDFSALIQGVGKRTFVIDPIKMVPFLESWRYPWADYIDNYWAPDRQTNIRYPRPVQNGGTTNRRQNSSYLQNAAYARLKNLQVGYTFNSGFIKKVKAQSVRIYFSGQDILTYSKAWYKFFDPESPNNVSYPYQYTATYALGLDVKF